MSRSRLRDVPPESITLSQRFVALVTASGTFDYSVTKANIGFRGTRRIFAGVLPTANGLHGFLDLMHQVDDRRFRTVSPYTKWLFVHIFHYPGPAGVHQTGWLPTRNPDRVPLERYAVRQGHCHECAEGEGAESKSQGGPDH
jgi:hypothetical protein